MSSTPKKYLSLEEAAAQLKVTRDQLVRLREGGDIRGFADRGTGSSGRKTSKSTLAPARPIRLPKFRRRLSRYRRRMLL